MKKHMIGEAAPNRKLLIWGVLNVAFLAGCGGGPSQSVNSPPSPPTTGGGPSSGPTIQLLYPSCVPAGEQFVDSVDNLLTVVGQGFTSSSVVRWNGSDRPTTTNGTVNGLVAQISASDIAAAGTAEVTVVNSGGVSSNALPFTITAGAVFPQSIAMDPAGKFAYVANLGCGGGVGGYVSMYTINATTGALTSIGTIAAGIEPVSVAVDPSGKFAYITNYNSNNVSMYTIDPSTGTLTSIGTIGAGQSPTLIATHPSGKFAYVTNSDANSVSMYSIDGATGTLTLIGTIGT